MTDMRICSHITAAIYFITYKGHTYEKHKCASETSENTCHRESTRNYENIDVQDELGTRHRENVYNYYKYAE